MISLLAGIAVAVTIFAAFLATLFQAVMQKGRGRWCAVAAVILTVLAMTTISWTMVTPTRLIGGLLVIASVLSAFYVKGLDRLWPVVLASFGVAAVFAVPFGL